MIEQDIVKYIATVQPALEKMANEKDSFMGRLNTKLNNMVKCGSLTKREADTIMKKAKNNPSNILDYLEIPSYQYRVGMVSKQANSNTVDPLYAFAFGS